MEEETKDTIKSEETKAPEATPAPALEVPAPATPVPAPEVPQADNKAEKFTRNIVRVSHYEKNRYYFEVDGEPFTAIVKGEEKESNQFSVNIITMMKTNGTKNPFLNAALTMATAKKGDLNPEIVCLAMTNAKISFERKFTTAEELEREDVKDDFYKTVITDIKPNIDEVSQMFLVDKIKNDLLAATAGSKPTLETLLAGMK